MNSNSGKEEHIPRNADVQEEFIKIIRGPKLNSYWKSYIRRRLNQSIIGKYTDLCIRYLYFSLKSTIIKFNII